MKFTPFYAGASVGAPSRCVLMIGKYGGRREDFPWAETAGIAVAKIVGEDEDDVPGC
jgi:hypothetical protein